MRRIYFGLIALTACVSHPPAEEAPPVTRQVKVDATNIVDLQRAGYTVTNEEGQKLYCRRDLITGSRVQFRTVCLTEREFAELQQRTRQNVQSMAQPVPPPVGH